MKKIYLTIFFIILLSSFTNGTLHIYNQIKEKSTKEDSLDLYIYTHSFLQNKEYFGPVIEGHTIAGHKIHPYVSYGKSKKLTSELGIFMIRNWADPKLFGYVMPTFSLKYQKKSFAFCIGNIHGGTAHNLIPPLYNSERSLFQGPETGLQIKYINSHTFLDIWLDWLTLLNKKKNIPEELVAGISYKQLITDFNKIAIRIPLQIMLYHLGGQGIFVKDYSIWMGTIGGIITYNLNNTKFLQNISLDTYYINNHYIKNIKRPFRHGQGLLNQISFNTTSFSIQVSHWNSYGFCSENLGNLLYQSISMIDKQIIYQERHRQLIFLHIKYANNLTNELQFFLEVSPYYDINNYLWEHEVGLHIIYTPFFSLIK